MPLQQLVVAPNPLRMLKMRLTGRTSFVIKRADAEEFAPFFSSRSVRIRLTDKEMTKSIGQLRAWLLGNTTFHDYHRTKRKVVLHHTAQKVMHILVHLSYLIADFIEVSLHIVAEPD